MLAVLRQRNFGLLWFGGLISMIGDWMLTIALPIAIYQLTGSALATGIMFLAEILPSLLLGSVAGVFVDRWDRQRTMVIANLLLALGLLPLLTVHDTSLLWLIYLVAFVESTIAQFFIPAENALLPLLVEKDDLPVANALNALNNNLSRLIGPAIGGLIAGIFGLNGVTALDVASFLIAALLIALLRIHAGTTPASEKPETGSAPANSLGALWHEWLAGLQLVRGQQLLFLLFVVSAITSLGEGVLTTLFIPFVTKVLAGPPIVVGWLMSSQAIGGLLGGIVIGWVARRIPPARLLGFCMLIFGLIDLTIFLYPLVLPTYWPALVLILLVGIPAVGGGTSFQTLLQTSVADQFRGRIFGAIGTTRALTSICGILLAGILGDVIGIVPVISIQGIVYMSAGVLCILSLRNLLPSRVSQPESVISRGSET